MTDFICNTTEADKVKIERLKLDITFGPAGATPGFTAEENQDAGFVGVYKSAPKREYYHNGDGVIRKVKKDGS